MNPTLFIFRLPLFRIAFKMDVCQYCEKWADFRSSALEPFLSTNRDRYITGTLSTRLLNVDEH